MTIQLYLRVTENDCEDIVTRYMRTDTKYFVDLLNKADTDEVVKSDINSLLKYIKSQSLVNSYSLQIAYNTRCKRFELLEIDLTGNRQQDSDEPQWPTFKGYGDDELSIIIPQFIRQIASIDQLLYASVDIALKTLTLESIYPVECIQYTFDKIDRAKSRLVMVGRLDLQGLMLRDRYGLKANDSQDIEYDPERQRAQWNDIAVELMNRKWNASRHNNRTGLFMHELAISNETIENVSSIVGLFSYIKALNIDFGDADLDRFSRWDRLFNYSDLESIDLSQYNGDRVEQLDKTFDQCMKLKSLNMHNFSGKSLEIMSNAFSNCYYLKTIDIANIDTQKVQTMYRMFSTSMQYNKDNPQDITLDIQNCKSLYEAFQAQCIRKLTLTNKLGTRGKLEDIAQAFQNATIDLLDIRQVDTSAVSSLSYCFYGYKTDDYLDGRQLIDGVVFISGHKELGISLEDYRNQQVEGIIKIDCKRRKIDYDNGDCKNQYILAELDTRSLTEMDDIFREQNICSINLSHCDLSKLTWMDWAFGDMAKLKHFELYEASGTNNKDIKKMPELASMNNMFCGQSVQDVTLKIDAKNLLQIRQMFEGCPMLKSVDMGQIQTPLLQILQGAFANCPCLEDIDLSNMTTANVGMYSHQGLFSNDIRLKNIKISAKTQSKAAILVEEFMKRNQVRY